MSVATALSTVLDRFRAAVTRMRLRTALQDAWRRDRVARRARRLHPKLAPEVSITAPEQPVFLGCVAICRGEDDYLIEWLEFHRMMGVEHFFIYDNGRQPTTKKLLEPYIAERLVSHIPFPDLDWPGLRRHWCDYARTSIQEVAYGHCLMHYRHHCRFLLKLDIDEFVYPAQERHGTIVEAMRELDLDSTMGIEIPMLDFGNSGHLRKPEGLVIESYTKTRPVLPGAWVRRYKTIGNTAFIAPRALSHPHWYWYRLALGRRLSGARKLGTERANTLLRLNHYFTKSLEEYVRKGELNATGYMAGKETARKFLEINTFANQIENRDILRFVPALRERVQRRLQG